MLDNAFDNRAPLLRSKGEDFSIRCFEKLFCNFTNEHDVFTNEMQFVKGLQG